MIEPPHKPECDRTTPDLLPQGSKGVLAAGVRYGPLLALALFLGAMFWARARDPFSRQWFTLETAGHVSFQCVAVLPKPVRPSPVILYAHGAGTSLMDDGNDLRQMAEMGLAVVSVDYDPTNITDFADRWTAVRGYLEGQTWANPREVAWVGFGLGADQTLKFALEHPDQQPQLLVQLSGSSLPESANAGWLKRLRCPTLLIHGGKDELFPVADTEQLATALQTNGVPVALRILAEAKNGLAPDRDVVFRAVGEWCLSGLSGPGAWQHYHSLSQWIAGAPPLWPYLLPAFAAGALLYWRAVAPRSPADSGTPGPAPGWFPYRDTFRRSGRPPRASSSGRSCGSIALRVLAAILAVWALAESAVHLVTPLLPVNRTTLSLARRELVQPGGRADFDYLAAQPIWTGVRLKTLLDQVQLAGYTRRLVNWEVGDKIYLDDILLPVISGAPAGTGGWRRPLWEEFYPRIRHESDPAAAAQIIVRHLRERVTVRPDGGTSRDVLEIWRRQLTDPAGFLVVYTAALRSAGVAARLQPGGPVEFWDGNNWQAAPAPAILTW